MVVIASLALGVMSVVAIHTISERAIRATEGVSVQSAYQFMARKPNLSEGDYFDLRSRWRSGDFNKIKGMVPIIEGSTSYDGRLVRVLGLDPLADVAAGIPVTTMVRDDVRFINSGAAILISDRKGSPKLLGNLEIISVLVGSPEVLLVDVATAQNLLKRPTELDAIWLRTQEPQSRRWYEKVIPGINSALNHTPDSVQLAGYRVFPMRAWDPSNRFRDSIGFNLGMLGVLALIVGGFIVYQATWTNVARRGMETTHLYALGVSTYVTRGLFVFDNLVIGIIGSGLGVTLSLGAVSLLLDESLVDAWASTSTVAIVKGVGVGIGISLISSWIGSRSIQSKKKNMKHACVIVLAAAGIAVGLFPQSGLAGAFLVLASLCVIHTTLFIPVAIGTTLNVVRKFAHGSRLRRMSFRGGSFDTYEIRMTVSVLSIAIAVSIGMGLMIESFRQDFLFLLNQRLQPGLYLNATSGIDVDDLARELGPVEVRSYGRVFTTLNNEMVQVIAANLDGLEYTRYGYDGSNGTGALISDGLALRQSINVGDYLQLEDSLVTDPLRVVHVYRNYGEPVGRIILPQSSVNIADFVFDRMTLFVETERIPQVKLQLVNKYPEFQINDANEIRQLALDIFNQSFNLSKAMTVVAIAVAVLGLLGALVSVQGRRQREYKLLYAVGVDRNQLCQAAWLQSIFLAILSVVCAIPVGFAIAYVLCNLINFRAFDWTVNLQILFEPVFIPSALAIVAAATVSLLPSALSVSLPSNAAPFHTS